MADFYDHIDDERKAFIERQHMFFVATAPTDPDDGFPNLSPKGRTLLRVLGPNLVGYLDYPGSGNETAKHTAENGRITLMVCSFEPTAGIVRLYGRGRRVDLDDPALRQHQAAFQDDLHPYVRQAFFIDVEKVQNVLRLRRPALRVSARTARRSTSTASASTTPREFARRPAGSPARSPSRRVEVAAGTKGEAPAWIRISSSPTGSGG